MPVLRCPLWQWENWDTRILAEKAIRDGMCDLVMLGRPLLADPDWCKKAYAGEVERIRPLHRMSGRLHQMSLWRAAIPSVP